jgi:hypothetical protein
MAKPAAPKATIEAWLRGVGVKWDEAAVEIREAAAYSGPGLGVFALRDLVEGETLCTIPKVCIIEPIRRRCRFFCIFFSVGAMRTTSTKSFYCMFHFY